MGTPKLTWNDVVAGKRPRGLLELSELREILSKWIKVADMAVLEAVERNDMDMFVRMIHCGSLIAARYESLVKNSTLEERLSKVEHSLNGALK